MSSPDRVSMKRGSTGTQLAEAVLELLQQGKPFTRENLEATYVQRRRASWVEAEGRVAEKSRDGFQTGVVSGMIGMALARASLEAGSRFLGRPVAPHRRIPSIEDYYRGKVSLDEIASLRQACAARGLSLHSVLMDRAGWPEVPLDGRLLVSQQDALLLGGKVQAPSGYADHVVFLYPKLCAQCGVKLCIEVCSGQAITPGEDGIPAFDREKCIHCGACFWNCTQPLPDGSGRTNLSFRAGAGGTALGGELKKAAPRERSGLNVYSCEAGGVATSWPASWRSAAASSSAACAAARRATGTR